MKLSTRGHYAVTSMMELAINQSEKLITLADISEIQHISVSYLEQIFASLRKNNLVVGTRGPGGGYTLAKPANEISIADIITGVEEDVDTTLYAGRSHRVNIKRSNTEPLWENLNQKIYDFLKEISLDEFVIQHQFSNNSETSNFSVSIAA
ncbi:MAG: Rrf2 family transcriptional regulator [Methylococcales bacterium]|jgi:Rrf2 family transcriptional regulator, iron-sulfur cluster assembly transcription factor|nr:Rrf2 family transcriptional regulator [Methylococcales bacterium]MBT7410540.1 Rrf2 family transcriptional regulator [Methylococcales bacterium]